MAMLLQLTLKFGAQFIGVGFCVTLVLCGVSTLQGYHYFTRYNDKQSIRVLAGFILLLDFLSMALICQSVYYYMIPHYGSLAPLNAVTGELSAECLISAIITFISQMYFVYQLQIGKLTIHLKTLAGID
ncbi:hypothetical protein MSAN_01081600 [Mycena sanguinolenta]|uniref:Uncharacterized protein n=1 Tax=Mycena sanguinolenta TaxID=230812 RepID=A0A8H6YUQ2_9AGAR|nr:hypothetical protein MSAN_01081600 [Mycena sanguinolenta]